MEQEKEKNKEEEKKTELSQEQPEEASKEESSKTQENLNEDKLKEADKELEDEKKDLKKVDEELEEVDKKIEEDEKQEKVSDEKAVKNAAPKLGDEVPSEVDETQELIDELKEEKEVPKQPEKDEEQEKQDSHQVKTHIFALRTTANREDQVMDFVTSNAEKKGYKIYSLIRPHGMRGYIFLEAETKSDAEQAGFGIPYARGILPKEVNYEEIEHMLEQVKKEVNIQQNDIVEIISGPFKREKAKIIRVDKSKEEVVVELLEAAVPIPITLKLDAVKVIRRETQEEQK